MSMRTATTPRRLKHLIAVALFVTISAAGNSAFAQAINIDFGSFSPAPSNAFGAAAGQVGTWNDVTASAPTSTSLVDVNGSPTGATITVTTEDMSGNQAVASNDAELLMYDNFFSFLSPWSFMVNGLTNGVYDVFLYEPANTAVGTGDGSVNGVAFADINGGFSGTFVEGVNYLRLDNVTVTAGVLSAVGAKVDGISGIAGVQLVPEQQVSVPEPSSLLLLGTSALGLLGALRRRRQRV